MAGVGAGESGDISPANGSATPAPPTSLGARRASKTTPGLAATVLIDDWMPTWHFDERHSRHVNATVAQTMAAVQTMDLGSSRTVRALYRLRGLPETALTLQGFLDFGFVVLQEAPDELVIGFVMELGRAGPASTDPAAFAKYDGSRALKGTFNFHATATDQGTLLVTETRVQALDRPAKRAFGMYWFFIRPFSGWIRRVMLKSIARAAAAG